MVKIYVTKNLEKDINKRLSKKEADNVFLQFYSLKENPFKGDLVTVVGKIVVKELKYKKFRFYFFHSNNILKILSLDDLKNEIIKFVAMSDKSKEQQKVINRLKSDIKNFGFDWF
ncbi:MAG: hypothetical protein ACMXX9_01610 [Candidatus Woesearchaeota archaeon]